MGDEGYSYSEQKQKDYYNAIATKYDEHYGSPEALKYRFEVYDSILKDHDLNGFKVLDAMCGGGQSTKYFLSKGCEVYGIDISDKQCEQYHKNFPDLEIKCGSIFNSGYPDNHFDFIFANSLHHLHPNVDDGMREFSRILKPGGKVLIWDPAAKSIFDYIRKIWYRLDRKYFEENEKSIDLKKLVKSNSDSFKLVKKKYGGNVAYVFVLLSMPLRIPSKIVRLYAKPLFTFEKILTHFQSRFTALWILALLEKK